MYRRLRGYLKDEKFQTEPKLNVTQALIFSWNMSLVSTWPTLQAKESQVFHHEIMKYFRILTWEDFKLSEAYASDTEVIKQLEVAPPVFWITKARIKFFLLQKKIYFYMYALMQWMQWCNDLSSAIWWQMRTQHAQTLCTRRTARMGNVEEDFEKGFMCTWINFGRHSKND